MNNKLLTGLNVIFEGNSIFLIEVEILFFLEFTFETVF